MKRWRWRILTTTWVCLYAGLLILLLTAPTDFAVLMPGPAVDTREMLLPRAQLPGDRGRILAATVGAIPHTHLLKLIEARLTPAASAIPSRQLLSPEQSLSQFQTRGRQQMEESKAAAQVAALRYWGIPARPWGSGAEIVGLMVPAPADLLEGDVIVRTGDFPIHTAWDLASALQGARDGDTVQLSVLRRGSLAPVAAQVRSDDRGRPTVGAHVLTVDPQVITADPVTIDAADVIGPSAGLMLSLAVLDRLAPEPPTRGHAIAGTGTITPSGQVGPIGGVVQKVYAAELVGAEYFLAPLEDYREAARVARGLKVVPVASLSEAVDFLRSLPPKT